MSYLPFLCQNQRANSIFEMVPSPSMSIKCSDFFWSSGLSTTTCPVSISNRPGTCMGGFGRIPCTRDKPVLLKYGRHARRCTFAGTTEERHVVPDSPIRRLPHAEVFAELPLPDWLMLMRVASWPPRGVSGSEALLRPARLQEPFHEKAFS
jgi:hypothetical protein